LPPELRGIVTRALVLRVLLVLLIHGFDIEDRFAADHYTYNSVAMLLASYWSGDSPLFPWKILSGDPRAYYYILASFYYVFGPYPLLPKLLNAAVGAFSVRLAYRLAFEVTQSTPAALRVSRYVAYFPSLILWSSLNLRDAWVGLLLLIVWTRALRLYERFSFGALVTFGIAVLALSQFRGYLVVAVVAPLAVSFLALRRGQLVRNTFLGMLLSLVLIYADSIAGLQSARALDLKALSEARRWSAQVSASGFGRDVDVSTPAKAAAFLPIGLVYFFLAPFPWMISNVRQAITLPEMLFYWSAIPAMFTGGRLLLRQRFQKIFPLLLITAGISVGYAVGQGNVGTMYRHRAQILPVLFVLAAAGKEARAKARGRGYVEAGRPQGPSGA